MPLATHALQYGTGVFEGIRGYWHNRERALYLLKPKEHFDRLLQSARVMGWEVPYKSDDMVDILRRLILRNKPKRDVYARPFIFQASTNLGPLVRQDLDPQFAMYMIGLGAYLAVDKGLAGKVSSWRRIDDTMIPPRAKICGTYVNSCLARREALEYGAQEAIFLNQDGSVSEGSGENIFIVRKGVLITPAVSHNILEGITRQCVIDIASDLGIRVIERDIDRSELYIADEVFLTGTACQIAYFSKIDNRVIGTGQRGRITAKLQKVYFDAVKNKIERYADWLIKVNV